MAADREGDLEEMMDTPQERSGERLGQSHSSRRIVEPMTLRLKIMCLQCERNRICILSSLMSLWNAVTLETHC